MLKRLGRRVFRSRLTTFVFAFVLGTAFSVALTAAATGHDGLYPKLEVFAKVVAHIKNNYVEDVDESKLIYGAIRGMVTSLDPHSAFMDPEEYRMMLEDSGGEFGGLGFEFFQKEDGLLVLSPIDDSPAARAGIQAGDLILAIDGILTRGLSLGDATKRLKGPPGTQVKLLLMRQGFAKPREMTLTRDHVRIIAVDGRLIDGQVAYVRIKSFQDHTDDDLKKKLTSLRAEAGGQFKGLILDLRNNPGGLLDQGVKVADRFLTKGIIVTTRGRGGRHPESEMATAHDTEPNYPMIVLINRGSASASEVVAGALQDHRRAILMGTRSFGKGSVQTVIDLDDGSALKLTIARYYTPSGRSIQGKGIPPDVLVQSATDTDDRGEWMLPGIITNDAPGVDEPQSVDGAKVVPDVQLAEQIDDDQLRAAVRSIKAWDQFQAALEAQLGHSASLKEP